MKLDLPTPGVPVSPTRSAGAPRGASRAEQRRAPPRGGRPGSNSTRVIARASARRSPAANPPRAPRAHPPPPFRRFDASLTILSPSRIHCPLASRPDLGIPLVKRRNQPRLRPSSKPPGRIRPCRFAVRCAPAWSRSASSRPPRRVAADAATFDLTLSGIPLGTVTLRRRPDRARTTSPRSKITPQRLAQRRDRLRLRRPRQRQDRRVRQGRRRCVSRPTRARRGADAPHRDRMARRRPGAGLGRAAAQAARPIRRRMAGALDPVSAGFALLRDTPPDAICDTSDRRVRRLAPVAAVARQPVAGGRRR